jgi:hypothetical protein
MSRSGEPPTTATMSVPSWMWGGSPAKFFAVAGLRGQLVPESAEHWKVRTEESYRRVGPGLFTVDHLLGPAAPRPRLELLTMAAEQSLVPDPGGALREQVAERVQRTPWQGRTRTNLRSSAPKRSSRDDSPR